MSIYFKGVRMDGGSGSDQKHVALTKAEFEALQTKDPTTVYFITDDNDDNAGFAKLSVDNTFVAKNVFMDDLSGDHIKAISDLDEETQDLSAATLIFSKDGTSYNVTYDYLVKDLKKNFNSHDYVNCYSFGIPHSSTYPYVLPCDAVVYLPFRANYIALSNSMYGAKELTYAGSTRYEHLYSTFDGQSSEITLPKGTEIWNVLGSEDRTPIAHGQVGRLYPIDNEDIGQQSYNIEISKFHGAKLSGNAYSERITVLSNDELQVDAKMKFDCAYTAGSDENMKILVKLYNNSNQNYLVSNMSRFIDNTTNISASINWGGTAQQTFEPDVFFDYLLPANSSVIIRLHRWNAPGDFSYLSRYDLWFAYTGNGVIKLTKVKTY